MFYPPEEVFVYRLNGPTQTVIAIDDRGTAGKDLDGSIYQRTTGPLSFWCSHWKQFPARSEPGRALRTAVWTPLPRPYSRLLPTFRVSTGAETMWQERDSERKDQLRGVPFLDAILLFRKCTLRQTPTCPENATVGMAAVGVPLAQACGTRPHVKGLTRFSTAALVQVASSRPSKCLRHFHDMAVIRPSRSNFRTDVMRRSRATMPTPGRTVIRGSNLKYPSGSVAMSLSR
jgi:hypothetical protein